MAVVLAILKTIGMILLVLLVLCVLLLCAALFVPVRYRVTVETAEEIEVRCQISWLLRVVYIVQETMESGIRIRIFGIPLDRIRKIPSFFRRTKKTEEKKEETKETPETEEAVIVTTDFSDERVQENPLAQKPKPVSGDRSDSPKKKKKKRKKKGFSFDKISSIITFIKDPANKRGIRTVKKELLALLRYVAPEKIDGKIVFGTGDPCTTGWLLGAVSMVPLAYTDGLQICPEFEEKRFQADGYVKGKARLIYMVRLVIRGYLDPDIKRWIDQALGK